MAISNFGELKTAVSNWLADSTLDSRIPEFITLAEGRIRRDVRVRFRAMETTSSLTISSRSTALPTRFVGTRRFYLSGSPNRRMQYLTPDNYWIRHLSNETGEPKFYTIEGDNLLVGPAPDSSKTGVLLHYASFAPFSSDSDENTLLTDHAGIYLYGALVEAAGFIGDDPRISIWAQMYDDAAEQLKVADEFDRHPQGELVARSDVQVA